jgi:hypothetical protein
MNHLTLKILATIVFTLGLLHGCDEKYSSRSKITQSEPQSAGSSAKLDGNSCWTDALQCPDGSYVSRNPNNSCKFEDCNASTCTVQVTTCQAPPTGLPPEFKPPPQECTTETKPCSDGTDGSNGDGSSCLAGTIPKTTQTCREHPVSGKIDCDEPETECVSSGGSTPGTVPPSGGNSCTPGEEDCYSPN